MWVLPSAPRLPPWSLATPHSNSHPACTPGRTQLRTSTFLFLQKKVEENEVTSYCSPRSGHKWAKNALPLERRRMNQAISDLSSVLQDPGSRLAPQGTTHKLNNFSGGIAQCRTPEGTCRNSKAFFYWSSSKRWPRAFPTHSSSPQPRTLQL